MLGGMSSAAIHTERLDLVPMTPSFIRASLDGDFELAQELLGLSLPAGWPDIPAILKLRLEQLESDAGLQPWLLRAIRLRATGEMIGHVGFHTAPGPSYLEPWSSGGVEFGCSIFASHRRRGYAREACVGLMRWASAAHGVAEFVVTVGKGNAASVALASALGFELVGAHVDEVDGVEDVLIRRWSAAA
jgi:RimJ/RimL family protein N-acetyltransferase